MKKTYTKKILSTLVLTIALVSASIIIPNSTTAEASTQPVYSGKIAYAGGGFAQSSLSRAALSDQQRVQLASYAGYLVEPQVSPDGTKITYLRCATGITGNCDVYLANIDGTNELKLTELNASLQRPQFSPNGNTIVFERSLSGTYRIFSVGADGSNLTNLTVGASGSDFMPVFSPNGSKIAFYTTRHGSTNREIYAMNADGSGQSRLTNAANDDYRPRWSPDGTKIVFYSNRLATNNHDIYVMNADGSGQTQLTSASGHDDYPDWNNDGSKIVFQSVRDGNSEIYAMNANGSNQTRLTINSASDRFPQFSYDGNHITYSSCGDTLSDEAFSCDVWVMEDDGSNNVNISNTPTVDDNNPRFLPDSSKVIYTSFTKYSWTEVMAFNPSTGHTEQITSGSLIEDNPVWSPDGTKIAFERTISGTREIFVINADGSNEIRLTTNSVDDVTPTWSPDGQKVIYVRNNTTSLHQIYTVNSDGTNGTALGDNTSRKYFPSYSPDGSKILYLNYAPSTRLVVMNSDGSNKQNYVVGRVDGTNSPKWSPDGAYIVYDHYDTDTNYTWQVELLNVATGTYTSLTQDNDHDYNCYNGYAWSPDSQFIVSCRINSDWSKTTIAVINRDTAAIEEIDLEDQGIIEFDNILMSPDGKNLALSAAGSSGVYGTYIYNFETDEVSLLSDETFLYDASWQSLPNIAPVTVNDTATTSFDAPILIDVLANDADEESLNSANLTITAQPTHGTAVVESGKVKYAPELGYQGADSLTYQICDSFLLDQKCSTGAVSITVQGPAPPAVTITNVNGDTYKPSENHYQTANLRPTFSGTATPGSEIKVEIHSDPIILTTTANGSGYWSVTPTFDLPSGEHMVYISATLNGLTTTLGSFGLSIGGLADTGVNLWTILLLGGGTTTTSTWMLRRRLTYIRKMTKAKLNN